MNKNHGLVNMVYNEKTEVQDSANYNLSKCPLHNANDALKNCNEFKILSSNKQKKLLHENNICFKCWTFQPGMQRTMMKLSVKSTVSRAGIHIRPCAEMLAVLSFLENPAERP